MLDEHFSYLSDSQRSRIFREAVGRIVQLADHTPVPAAEAPTGQIVLGCCDGGRTVQEILTLFPTPKAIPDVVSSWPGNQTQ